MHSGGSRRTARVGAGLGLIQYRLRGAARGNIDKNITCKTLVINAISCIILLVGMGSADSICKGRLR